MAGLVRELAEHRTRVETELRRPGGEEVAARELAPSPLFNVAAAQLGAPTEYTQQSPTTLEDYFTLVHQSLLQVVSSARQELGLTHERLAPPLRSFVQTLLQSDGARPPAGSLQRLAPKLLGIELEPGQTTIRLVAPLREHGLTLLLTHRQDAPSQLQAHVEIYSEYDEGNRNLRALLAAELLTLAVGGHINPSVRSTFSIRRPVARWQWVLPIDGPSAPLQAARVRDCLRYVADTSYDVMSGPRRLSVLLDKVSAFVPDVVQRLDTLTEATFRRAPWYNEQFFLHFVATQRTHTPGFAALCAAIDAAPEGQNKRWGHHSVFDRVEEAPGVATAQQLLAAWRSNGLANLSPGQLKQPLTPPLQSSAAGASGAPATDATAPSSAGAASFLFFPPSTESGGS